MYLTKQIQNYLHNYYVFIIILNKMNTPIIDPETIIKTIKDRKLTAYKIVAELPEGSGITEVGLNKILNGTTKKPRQATLTTLHNYLHKTYANQHNNELNLIRGVEEPEAEILENKNANSFIPLPSGQFLMVMPLAEFNIQAGLLDIYQDIEYLQKMAQHSIIVNKPAKGRYIAFRVKGDSMDDGTSRAIVQDSIVTTRELQKQHWTSSLRKHDFPYWVIYTTQARYPLLKEIVKHDVNKGIITCHSLNDAPEYSDFDLHLDDVQALFYVVDVHRQLSKLQTY